MTFDQLQLLEPIKKALRNEGYEQPTPIQEQAIPQALEGRDVLGCAQTGTGKTAAFSIPILQRLSEREPRRKGAIRSLILTPTRELAVQIGDSLKAYGRFLSLRHTVVFGGVPQHQQTKALRRGVDILVATPGRLIDLIGQGFIKLNDVEIFVLDEADRMLDMGFINDVKRLVTILPQERQTLFFSATMPSEIAKLSSTILQDPVRVEVTPVASTAEKVEQGLYYVAKPDKRHLLVHLLSEQPIDSALVFTRTKHGADRVVKDLNRAGIKADAIHGNKSQNARQRALNKFKAQQTRVLVATDIASRGIDVDQLSHVINFDLPNEAETYVHRIGRTGRAGASGVALSFCDHEERSYLKSIHKLINRQISVVEDHPYPMSKSDYVPEEKPKSRGRRNGGGGFKGRKGNFSRSRKQS